MTESFQALSGVERVANRVVGWLAARGLAPGYMRQLTVRGRKTGRRYTTPVNLIEHAGHVFLVAPRGRTQWTRNAEAAGEVELERGAQRSTFAIRTTALDERPELLKRYLEAYSGQVQRFFRVRADAPLEEFATIAADHPVYELIPK